MNSEKTFYDILGVPEQANEEVLKKAYRRMAQRLHPDRNQSDPLASFHFQQLQEAYQVLSNPLKRTEYDIQLKQTYQDQEAVFVRENGSEEPQEHWFDHVKQWFRKPRSEWDAHGPGGYHIHFKLPISWQEAWYGTFKTIDVRVAEICPVCRGHLKNCIRCRGTGQIFFNRRFKVTIPKGAKPQQILRLFEQGHSGPYTEGPGDILIRLIFEIPYPWNFDGDDVYRLLFLSEKEAYEGGNFSVKVIDGSTGTVKLPGLLKTGQKIRLKGYGWSTLSGYRSDAWLIVRVKVTQAE